jgi:hypothetical protein
LTEEDFLAFEFPFGGAGTPEPDAVLTFGFSTARPPNRFGDRQRGDAQLLWDCDVARLFDFTQDEDCAFMPRSVAQLLENTINQREIRRFADRNQKLRLRMELQSRPRAGTLHFEACLDRRDDVIDFQVIQITAELVAGREEGRISNDSL